MITIQKINNLHLTIKGHAGSVEQGDDLVCAAVSVLVESVKNYMPHMWYKTGNDNELALIVPNSAFEICMFNYFVQSMDVLIAQYPDFIQKM